MATADDAIRILNEALQADPDAVNRIFQHVRHNGALNEHPTIQVGMMDAEGNSQPHLSALGLINGIFGVQPGTSWGWIAVVLDTDVKPARIIRFEPAVVPQGHRQDAQQS